MVTNPEPSLALLANQRVRLSYDLSAGTFDLVEQPSGRPLILGAGAGIAGASSREGDRMRSARLTTGADELGPFRRLTVTCSAPGRAALLAEFTLHGDESPLVLRAGLANTTTEPLRIREFQPLAEGRIFPGGEWTDLRTLNGDSACAQAIVTDERFRISANNLLLTLRQEGRRRSLVLGALKTADFTKWAATRPAGGRDFRREALHRALPGARLVAYRDCGGPEAFLPTDRITLAPRTGSVAAHPASSNTRWAASLVEYHRPLVFAIAGLNPDRRYALGFSWWDGGATVARTESVIAIGDGERHPLLENAPVPPHGRPPEERGAVLPAACHRGGACELHFEGERPSVAEIWIWELDPLTALPAEWRHGRPTGYPDPSEADPRLPVVAALEANDPVGRLVAPGETYWPEDSFHVDAGTSDPFVALERYGERLRACTHARLNHYDFPTVCAWYAGVWKTEGAQNHPGQSTFRINTSAGLVEEAEAMGASGFLRHARAAVRLVPDTYALNNPQGWWDDEHWRREGYYTAPYETSAALGRAMHDRGCLAFTYLQPCTFNGLISQDFRLAHPGWLLGGVVEAGLDCSLAAVQEHLRSRFAALRGHLDGFMVDYADQFWRWSACPGGYADPGMTATAFYRTFFARLREGIGPEGRLHERNLYWPNNDLTLGLVDSQRTSNDTDKITPDLVACSGLRWYKNRVVLGYDMDSKELRDGWKVDGWSGSERDGRRMLLTMAYVAASRLLLANSFRTLPAEALQDLARTFPYPAEARPSARPIDAFVTAGRPRIYDFAVAPNWHQVTLCNDTRPTREATIAVALAGDPADGALGLRADRSYYVYDFWNDRFVGCVAGSDRLAQTLRPGEARMLSVHEREPNPQFLSTNRHLMQGYLDLPEWPVWEASSGVLHGAANVVGGEAYEIILALNGFCPVAVSAASARVTTLPVDGEPDLLRLRLEAPANATVRWQAACRRVDGPSRQG